MDIVRQIYLESRRYKPCGLFRGTESMEELAELFLSSQGIEFCLVNEFPSREIFRRLKEHDFSRMGIHIDEGKKALKNPRMAVLVGDCDFLLEYDTLDYPCKVVLMHGARAHIKASGFTVVRVEKQKGCGCNVETSNSAIVI